MRRIDLVVVHHSASSRGTTLETIDRWHRDRGWRGCGYHYVIEEDGAVRVGRPVHEVGAHARGHNRRSIGVCVTGNNASPGQEWSDAQRSALHGLLVALRTVWPAVRIVGHRDLPGARTECPGLDVATLDLPGGLALRSAG